MKNIRNLAIIAHVDHGKTTLIDGLFRASGNFADKQLTTERVMDSGDLEKEKGITIRAKNASFEWKGTQINIVDTPGHADFGGEVERALFMVDGALLLVDAAEGPLPQTRFVLRKALERNIKIILVINKVDRPDARIEEIEEKVLELFFDLAKDEGQANYHTVYGSAKEGWASQERGVRKANFDDLLDLIVQDIPPPQVKAEGPFKMLVTNLAYSSFVGQIAVGRIEQGRVRAGERLTLIDANGKARGFSVTALEHFAGLGTARVENLEAGEIALVAGCEAPKIGDTISSEQDLTPLPRIHVDPPMVSVRLSVNTSPLAGQEGKYVTSRKLEELLERATLHNVALSYDRTDNPEVFLLKARGELQIGILLEELRREGYELMVGRPEIIPLDKDGQLWEPEELMVLDLPQGYVGAVTELLSTRGGRMENMERLEGSERVRLEFKVPTRGLIGVRSNLLTQTRGEAVFSSSFNGYIPYQGKRFSRQNGALVSDRDGETIEYALFHLQPRGKLFVTFGRPVYEGMVIGEHSRRNDLNCNPVKEKKLTNIRAAGRDESTKLDVVKELSLEGALEWIDEDEWVEITPKSIRVRKDELRTNMRKITRE